MRIIGNITRNPFNNGYKGKVNTMNINFNFFMQEISDKKSDKTPDFNIFLSNGTNEPPSIGAAWKKVSNKNEKRTEFFSISFDDPSFDKPLNVAAFPDGSDSWNITWDRKQEKSPIAD